MKTYLLTHSNLEEWLRRPEKLSETEIGICPIIELVMLCELTRKGKSQLTIDKFRSGLKSFIEGPCQNGQVILLPLTQNSVSQALFDKDEYGAISLWEKVLENVPPDQTVRRLLLRPSNSVWWDDRLYYESEILHLDQ